MKYRMMVAGEKILPTDEVLCGLKLPKRRQRWEKYSTMPKLKTTTILRVQKEGYGSSWSVGQVRRPLDTRYIVRKSRRLNVTWEIIDTKMDIVLAQIGNDRKYAITVRDTLNGKDGSKDQRTLLKAFKEMLQEGKKTGFFPDGRRRHK